MPVSMKKSQNAGAVYATIVLNPSGVVEDSSTSTSAITPCSSIAFARRVRAFVPAPEDAEHRAVAAERVVRARADEDRR